MGTTRHAIVEWSDKRGGTLWWPAAEVDFGKDYELGAAVHEACGSNPRLFDIARMTLHDLLFGSAIPMWPLNMSVLAASYLEMGRDQGHCCLSLDAFAALVDGLEDEEDDESAHTHTLVKDTLTFMQLLRSKFNAQVRILFYEM